MGVFVCVWETQSPFFLNARLTCLTIYFYFELDAHVRETSVELKATIGLLLR